MDPAGAELAAIGGVDDAVAWIGMTQPVLQGLRAAMGDFRLLREIVLMPVAAWDEAVAAARVRTPAEEGQDEPPARALRALELGQVASLRRVARLRMGLAAADEGGPVPAGQGGGVGAVAGAQGAGNAGGPGARTVEAGTRKRIKMASVFDQSDDTEIWAWAAPRYAEVLAAYRAANDHEDAHPDEEATLDQLAALEHRLLQGSCPSPDFGVWRPYGHRLARQLRLTVHHITPGGDYLPHEVPGPPSFVDWLSAYRVFAMAMRALNAATHTRLLMYQHRVEKYNADYGQVCWWLLAQADQRMRSEHIGRIRRTLEAEHRVATQRGLPHDFNPAMPWDLCLRVASLDREFWEEELSRKCTLYMTHLKSQQQLLDPGHGAQLQGQPGLSSQPPRSQPQPGGGRPKPPRTPRQPKRPRNAGNPPPAQPPRVVHPRPKGAAQAPDGRWKVADDGRQICFKWNHSASGCSQVCSAGRAHVCEWCLKDHRTCEHRRGGK